MSTPNEGQGHQGKDGKGPLPTHVAYADARDDAD
jgi:hypothetical protein